MEDEELLRYSRQIMLPQFDIQGQERLGGARVLLIGVGGLGSPVAMYLAAAGVGRIVLVDFDVVDLSNLQRQIVHTTADIGRSKVESARESLLDLNPLIDVQTVPRALEGEALLTQVRRCDVVVDASDNLPTRLAVNAACVEARRPLVSGAALRLEGQLMVYQPQRPDSPCYRCVYRAGRDLDETCAETGVLAPVVGIIGSLQALEAIKVVTGVGRTLSGRLLLMDALTLEVELMEVARDPGCPACAHARA